MAVGPETLSDASGDKGKPSGKRNGAPTKVIIRRLPPTMTEAELVDQISPLPPYDYFLFVAADYSLAPWAFCRAYINFTNVEDVILFRDRFDGYVFVDNRGNEYPAMVEMAPSPKVPKKGNKRDAKCGTLEDDPEYKEFLESLKNPQIAAVMSMEQYLEEIDKKEKERKERKGGPKVPTPLTEFVKQKKEEKLRKKLQKEEERRKRVEWEKQMQEKQRQQREQAKRKEREAKKETAAERADVPPRFATKDIEQEKRKTNTAGAKGKKSNWKEERKHHDEATSSKYGKGPAKTRQDGDEKAGKTAHRASTEKKRSSFDFDDQEGAKKSQEHESHGAQVGSEGVEPKVAKVRNAPVAKGGERKAKASRYKEKPSMPLYQPGKKKPTEDTAK